jgi:hypothetical protein
VQPPDAYVHDGFYLRLGAGPGYGALAGSGPAGDASIAGFNPFGGSLVAIGGNIAPGLVLAGAVNSVLVRQTFKGVPPEPEQKATAALAHLGVLVDWFPDPTGGWHVGALAGIAALQVSDTGLRDLSDPLRKDSGGLGFGGALLGGYDFWIGPQWSAGLFAVGSATTPIQLADQGGDKTGYSLAGWSLGLQYAFTYH